MSFSSNILIEYQRIFTREELEELDVKDSTEIYTVPDCNKTCLNSFGPSINKSINKNCTYCNYKK